MFALLSLPSIEQRYFNGLYFFDQRLLGRGSKQRNETSNDEPYLSMGGYYLLHRRSEQPAFDEGY